MINAQALENKLNALKISGRVSGISENDYYTIVNIDFAPDITINKIRARLEDLAIFFNGSQVELDTAGGSVCLKVLKTERKTLDIYNFTHDIAGGLSGYEIPIIIGSSETGNRLYYDLIKCPHILTAGATGSGKSVFMHNLILSMFYAKNVDIMLIDIKKVEFSIYEDIPRLCHKIAYNAHDAHTSLKDLFCEMNRRYDVFKNKNVRNIQEYNDHGGEMRYITLFIDELADLILSDKRIEPLLIRLAQLGRAAGIHLIVATQRPDASILSGLIRANIPTRVCFAVQKATDSRIVLDMSGGEKLRGAGDGLFLPIGSKKPTRFQSPYISTDTLQKAVDMMKAP